jgi:hypothetical protein
MDYNTTTDLACFAAYYGFRHDLLSGADRYAIAHAPADFNGRIAAIRITENGRFGNIFYQLLHAVILARQLGAATIELFPFPGCPQAPAVRVEELRIVFRPQADAPAPPEPTLVGHFFNSFAFESALRALPPAFVWDTIQRYLKPLFGDALADLAPVGRHTLVMSFRAGDIFSGAAFSAWYVQPPASFYLQALAFARAECGVRDVRLVFEDASNPAIAAVQAALTAQGIPFASQSASFLEDLRCLAGASHLVVPYSTFGEVAAMLSDHVATYFAFRTFESHQHLHLRAQPLLLGVLRQKGVRAVLVDDAAGAYIPPRGWDRSPAQLRLMRDYGQENLRIVEGADADRLEAAEATAALRRLGLEDQSEASRLRHRLIASRHAADAIGDRLLWHERELARTGDRLRQSLQDAELARQRLEHVTRMVRGSTSWRITAPIRLAARAVRRLLGRPHSAAFGDRG